MEAPESMDAPADVEGFRRALMRRLVSDTLVAADRSEKQSASPIRVDERRVAQVEGVEEIGEEALQAELEMTQELAMHVVESASGVLALCGPRSERSAWKPSTASKNN